MLIRFYNFEHAINLFGHEIHFYDIPTIVLALLLVVMIIVHVIRSKKRKDKYEEDLEKQLEELRAEKYGTDDATQINTQESDMGGVNQ